MTDKPVTLSPGLIGEMPEQKVWPTWKEECDPDCNFETGKVHGWNNACDAWEPHATRLQTALTNALRQYQEMLAQAVSMMAERDALKAELTKARVLNAAALTLIEQFMPNVGKCFGIDFALLNETLIGLSAPAGEAISEPI